MLAFAEGLLLAERAGVDRKRAVEVMTQSPIGSPMLKARADLVLDLPEEAWFDVGLMQKDIVLALDSPNAVRGLNALLAIGYQLSIPARPEEFADATTRENWRKEKQMIVLKLWSDQHRRTPVDIFVYEPFDFDCETKVAPLLEVAPGLAAPVVSLPTLLEMKRTAGRPQDLIDITELGRMR